MKNIPINELICEPTNEFVNELVYEHIKELSIYVDLRSLWMKLKLPDSSTALTELI